MSYRKEGDEASHAEAQRATCELVFRLCFLRGQAEWLFVARPFGLTWLAHSNVFGLIGKFSHGPIHIVAEDVIYHTSICCYS